MIKTILVCSAIALCGSLYAQKSDSTKFVLHSVTFSSGNSFFNPSIHNISVLENTFSNTFPQDQKQTFNRSTSENNSKQVKLGVTFSKQNKPNTSYVKRTEVGIQHFNLQSEIIEYDKITHTEIDTVGGKLTYKPHTVKHGFSEKLEILALYIQNSYMVPLGNSFRLGIGYGASIGYTYSHVGELETTFDYRSKNSSIEQEKFEIKSALLQLSTPIQIEYALSKTKQKNTFRLFYEVSPSVSCMLNSSKHATSLLIANHLKYDIGLKYVFSN